MGIEELLSRWSDLSLRAGDFPSRSSDLPLGRNYQPSTNQYLYPGVEYILSGTGDGLPAQGFLAFLKKNKK